MGNCTSKSSAPAKISSVSSSKKALPSECAPKSECAPERSGLNSNEKIVEEWVKCYGTRSFDKFKTMTDSSALMVFVDAKAEMHRDDFATSCDMLFDSFPDITFRWQSIKEVSPGKVVVKNFGAQGTHTGVPFAFDPYPAIAATGKSFEDPPLDFTITIDATTGKITHGQIDSFGSLVGPPGIYTQIGGVIM
jgi:hypothetical protein